MYTDGKKNPHSTYKHCSLNDIKQGMQHAVMSEYGSFYLMTSSMVTLNEVY